MPPSDRSARQQLPLAGDPRRRTAAGRLGGLLFLGAGVVACAAHGTLSEPDADLPRFVPPLAAMGIGLLSMLLPWHRIAAGWLQLLPLSGALLIAASVAGHGEHGGMFAPLYFVVGAYAGYAFPHRREVVAHLGLVALCLAVPLYLGAGLEPQPGPSVAIGLAALVAVTGLVVAVRERMEAGQEALRVLAQTDPLTGVGNYRRLYGRLSYEIARHRRSGRPLALLVLDLDDFKSVNDSLGHLAGDRLLQQVARALEDTVREQDTVARQGGDEFAVLAPETGAEAADALGERIELALCALTMNDDRPLRASVGWAVYPRDGEERVLLLERADARQRAAKRARQASERSFGTRLSA